MDADVVLLADIGVLPAHAVGVDDLEEVAHQLGHGHAVLVERRLDALGVPVVGPLEAIAGPVRPPRRGSESALATWRKTLERVRTSPYIQEAIWAPYAKVNPYAASLEFLGDDGLGRVGRDWDGLFGR